MLLMPEILLLPRQKSDVRNPYSEDNLWLQWKGRDGNDAPIRNSDFGNEIARRICHSNSGVKEEAETPEGQYETSNSLPRCSCP